MSPRVKLPPGGDVPPSVAARRLWLSLDAFEKALPMLIGRGFPAPDPTTGNFDLDAIDEWRRRRNPHLFDTQPLPSGSAARDAKGLVGDRIARMRGG